MKTYWIQQLAHLNAQSAAIFVLFLLTVVIFALWRSYAEG
jgi:hypothetical protein